MDLVSPCYTFSTRLEGLIDAGKVCTEGPQDGSEPRWFSTLLSSIETSISRCVEPYEPISDRLTRSPEALRLDAPTAYVLPLSARSPEELDNLLWWWSNVLEDTSVSIERSCAIAARRRQHDHRVAVVASSREGLIEGLRSLSREKLVLWCEPGVSSSYVRLGVQHVRGKWVDWRSLYGRGLNRLFSAD